MTHGMYAAKDIRQDGLLKAKKLTEREYKDPVFRVSHARNIVKYHHLQAVVVIAIQRDGTLLTVTYGENKKKCAAIGDWAKQGLQSIFSKVPFQSMFGWGKGGVPTPLSYAEWTKLKEHEREYAKKWQGGPL